MAAVLRVKRRNDEEPLEALVIACKRRKITNLTNSNTDEKKEEEKDEEENGLSNDPVTAVLKFAGTLKNQGDDVIEHLTKTLSKEELKANFKQHVVNVASKARQETKKDSKESRFKIVSCFRSLDSENKLEDLIDSDKKMTVIDVEHSVDNKHEKTSETAEEGNYVYDLYYTQTGDDMLLDNLVSVHSLQEELVFGAFRENGVDSDSDMQSEDSNSESNWRNDYPDSDHSQNSICDEDMRSAVRRMNLEDEESDLSSDDYDENLVYSLAEDDVRNYGFKYAKYKAKIKAELDDELSEGVESDYDDDEDRQFEDP